MTTTNLSMKRTILLFLVLLMFVAIDAQVAPAAQQTDDP